LILSRETRIVWLQGSSAISSRIRIEKALLGILLLLLLWLTLERVELWLPTWATTLAPQVGIRAGKHDAMNMQTKKKEDDGIRIFALPRLLW
jgi:uncharacterized membrane protein YcaP (DUF421 family)